MKKGKQTIFYYADEKLCVKEVKRFRFRKTGWSLLATLSAIAVILAINHFYDFLGLGHIQINSLTQENKILLQRVTALSGQLVDLQKTIDNLNQQGNRLRLLVDLPTIDSETQEAGSGGAIESGEITGASAGVSAMLERTGALAEKLRREVKLEEQNYEEIARKYDHNKDYFAALPALKPMDGYYSPKGFGLRMHPVLGIFKTHEGLDIINDVGTPVYASGNGVIEFAGHSGGGYGNLIVINHGFGYQSLYAHLSRVLVKEGQQIKRGDLIGKSGKSGLVSGPHLHYEVHLKGVRQNPIDYFLDDIRPGSYLALAARK